MKKGGYQIIDLKNTNLTTGGTIVSGIYNAITENKRKVILLSGIVINGVELSDAFVKAIKVGDEYLLNVYSVAVDDALSMYDIFIEEDDTVTLQLNSVEGGSDKMENPMLDEGDLIVGGTDGEPERLEAGNEGEVLTVGSNGVEWSEPTPSGMENPMTAPDDLIIGGVGGSPARLGAGTAGQVLSMGLSGVEWAAPASAGVSSVGGATGAITLGSGLSMTGNELSASGGGGGGSSIGGAGYKFSATCANLSSGNYVALALGLYNGNYGFHKIIYTGNPGYYTVDDSGAPVSEFEITNCSIVIFTIINTYDLVSIDTNALYGYDGVAITTSNIASYEGKMLYAQKDFEIFYQD